MKESLIKSVKQLPAWFKLESYKKSKHFNANEWYDELMPRLVLRYCLKRYGNDPKNLPPNWECIKQKGLLFHEAKDEEIKYRISAVNPDLIRIMPIEEKASQAQPEVTSIATLTNFHIYVDYSLVSDEQRDKIKKNIKIMLDTFEGNNENFDEELELEARLWSRRAFSDFAMDQKFGLENKFAYPRINLEASDEQIKKDFATWLDKERKRRGKPAPKKNFSDAELDSWYESSVLPYLDLLFWAELEEVKISQYVIAQAIFPDAYSMDCDTDPLGRLKTTKKKADYLMHHDTMKLLELQITE